MCAGAFSHYGAGVPLGGQLYTIAQKLTAEFVGTFAFVLIGAGSVCADEFLRAAGQPSIGPLGIALAYGLTYAIMASVLGHISGGHFNPAVTLGYWATKRQGSFSSLAYVVVQLLGGIVAAFLLKWTVPEAVWRPVAMGTPDLAADLMRGPGMWLEGTLTFLLVFVIFAASVDPRGAFRTIAGFGAGLTITVAMLLDAPFTGAALNPARVLGPAMASHHWTNHGVYWVAPMLGGLFAAFAYETILLKDA